jgi:hypothetical protein
MRKLKKLIYLFIFCQICFVSLCYLKTYIPAEILKERALEGFRNGWLSLDDSDRFNRHVGLDAFSDCLHVQMAFNRTETRFESALGALILNNGDPNRSNCGFVRDLASGEVKPGVYGSYHRYWHGTVTLTSFLLYFFKIKAAKLLLRDSLYLTHVLALPLLYFWSLEFFIICCPFILMSLFYSSIPYIGTSFTHSPTQIVAMLAFLVALIRVREWQLNWVKYEAWALMFGCFAAFFDNMTGGMPLGASIVLLVTGIGLLTRQAGSSCDIFIGSFRCLVLFALGYGGTFIVKQLIVLPHYGYGVIDLFSHNLMNRVNGFNIGFKLEWEGLRDNLHLIGRNSHKLGIKLFFAALYSIPITFILQKFLAKNLKASPLARAKVLMIYWCVIPTLGWFLVFKSHAYVHQWFMARFLFLPVAFSFSALIYTVFCFLSLRYDENHSEG